MSHHLRFRQVHLDFHTSPHIPDIGERFNKREYQRILRESRVNSITTFALCHHGWSYYDTKVGKRHPNLKFDLLRAQFDACKEIDVNVPIYMTGGVHCVMAEENPGWREVNEKGQYAGLSDSVFRPGFKKMCFNTPYLDYLCEQIKEVVQLFPNCDGIFLDIIRQGSCCCEYCVRSMSRKGYDPENSEDRRRFANEVLDAYYKKTTAAVKFGNPGMPVFHNSGHITVGNNSVLDYFSHLELESLPTGGWGYDHFPMSAKYCQKLDKDFLGMTGKFHTTWGEFGGYKHPNALRYECAAMLAFGAKCCVGDQLHPNGEIDKSTYQIIGAAYREVEEKEPWCDNTVNVADIALLSSAATNPGSGCKRESSSDVGAARILLEGHFLFDIIDTEMDFTDYKMMILPDDVKICSDLKRKLDIYLENGGKLMLTGNSGLNEAGTRFIFEFGAKYLGKNEYDPDYLVANAELRPSFTSSPLVMYGGSNRLKVTSGKSLGKVCNPFFNRTYKHFCSHQHTPNNPDDYENDCGVVNGNILYLAHPVFSIYRSFGAVAYKDYAVKAINKLLANDHSLKTNLPSTARVSVMAQPRKKRYVLHLLYANTIARGGSLRMSGGNLQSSARSVEVIEELLPLRNTEIELKLPRKIRRIALEPQGEELLVIMKKGRCLIRIPEFTCHQMIVLSYECPRM